MSEPIFSREELQRRIAARLDKLDDDSLLRLDAISEYAEQRARPLPMPISGGTEAVALSSSLSRRKFLIGVGTGGVVLAGTAIGGGLLGSALNSPELLKLKALLALYEELEQIGIDALVSAALSTIGALLGALKTVAGLVSAGVKLVDNGLATFEQLFPVVRQALSLIEGLVAGLARLVRDVQQALADVTGITRPVSDAIGKFFSDLLDKIPFGVGANVRNLINQLVALVGMVPSFIESLNTQLITPLRRDWFTDDEKKGLKGNLLEPTRKNLLQPTINLLQELEKLSAEWEKTVTPINRALAQRANIRNQIAEVQAGVQVRPTSVP